MAELLVIVILELSICIISALLGVNSHWVNDSPTNSGYVTFFIPFLGFVVINIIGYVISSPNGPSDSCISGKSAQFFVTCIGGGLGVGLSMTRDEEDENENDNLENKDQLLSTIPVDEKSETNETDEEANFCCCKASPSNLFGIATCISIFVLVAVVTILFLLCALIYFTDVMKTVCGTLGMS